MTIWSYLSADGTLQHGVPVNIWLAGYSLQFVAQFDPPAVVHWPTGAAVCAITDQHYGYPEQRAQAAVREQVDAQGSADIWRLIKALPTINELPRVVS